jgi:uncharacterized protein GlcG (DUF336 family)
LAHRKYCQKSTCLATHEGPCQYYAPFGNGPEKGGSVRVVLLLLTAVLAGAPLADAQVLTERNISLQLARTIADASIAACKADGFDVTVAVVDRAGDLKLLLRADTSNPHNADLARRKAYTARTFGVTSTEFRNRTQGDGELTGQRYLAEVVPLGGGLPIVAGTDRIGGLGLSGAPDQAADEKCARAGLAAAAASLK